jgi:hypothetical protein
MEGLKDKVIVFAGGGGIATATARCLGQGGAKVARDTTVVDIELGAWVTGQTICVDGATTTRA